MAVCSARRVSRGARARVAGDAQAPRQGAGRRRRRAGHAGPAAQRKEDVNRRNADGSTPLQWAVYNGDVAEAKRLLRAGADVTLANNYGATPMSLAAEVGNTEMLKVLLEAGADADSPNPDGQTALLAVARTGNVEAAQLLLNARRHRRCDGEVGRTDGADVGVGAPASGDDGAADLQGRRRQRRAPPIATTSVISQAEGRPKSLDSGGLTPLLYAARENCMACVEVLLKNKADINLADPDGVSPLLVAIMNANWDIAKQLIDGRRRRQPVGHLRRDAAVHGDRPAHPARRRTRRPSIR